VRHLRRLLFETHRVLDRLADALVARPARSLGVIQPKPFTAEVEVPEFVLLFPPSRGVVARRRLAPFLAATAGGATRRALLRALRRLGSLARHTAPLSGHQAAGRR
jgi:hypothetical protein